MIKFGISSTPIGFFENGYKNTEQMPEYVNKLGLDAYEYQCSRGVKVSDEKAYRLKEQAQKYDIVLSVHAPYYISLSTQEEEKKINTIRYITDTMKVAQKMGAKEIVVHAGGLLGLEREYAVDLACKLLKRAYEEADKLGLSEVIICPETMGKVNQLGTSEEVIKMCRVDERLKPTIDFGHIYCRTYGQVVTADEWERELQKYIDELGYDRVKNFHAHFSQMEYSIPGGEKRHVTFAEKEYGPSFVEVAKALKKLKLEPTILCESAGTQDVDSIEMKKIYYQI